MAPLAVQRRNASLDREDLIDRLLSDEDPLPAVIADLRQRGASTRGAALVLVDPIDSHFQIDRQQGLTDGDLAAARYAIDEGLIDWTIQRDQPHVLRFLAQGARAHLLCLPLVEARGAIGALVAPTTLTQTDLADALSGGLDRTRRIAALAFAASAAWGRWHLARAQLDSLSSAARVLASAADLNENLKRIVDLACQARECTGAAIYVPDRADRALDCRAVAGPINPSSPCALGSGVAGWVADHRAPLLVSDYAADVRIGQRTADPPGLCSCVAAPVSFGSGMPGVLVQFNLTDRDAFNGRDLAVLLALARQAAAAIERARLYEDLQASYMATIFALATAIEARDPYTGGHSERVTRMALKAAEHLAWPEDQRCWIHQGGILHDVGKIAVPDAILRKPGRLTDEEFAIIKSHPTVGARMLEGISHLANAVPYVLHHQERFDGTGYPAGLVGEAIPVQGRLLAVADTIDAITSNRPYRAAAPLERAIAVVKEESGRQFDPTIANAYMALYESGDLGAYLASAAGRDMQQVELQVSRQIP